MIVTRMGCLIATIASSVGSLPVSHWAAAPSGGEKTQSFKSNAEGKNYTLLESLNLPEFEKTDFGCIFSLSVNNFSKRISLGIVNWKDQTFGLSLLVHKFLVKNHQISLKFGSNVHESTLPLKITLIWLSYMNFHAKNFISFQPKLALIA